MKPEALLFSLLAISMWVLIGRAESNGLAMLDWCAGWAFAMFAFIAQKIRLPSLVNSEEEGK